MRPKKPRDLKIGDDYYILASSLAELPKLVLKHDEAFLVADQHGDLPRVPPSELGFYVKGTRFLRELELQPARLLRARHRPGDVASLVERLPLAWLGKPGRDHQGPAGMPELGLPQAGLLRAWPGRCR